MPLAPRRGGTRTTGRRPADQGCMLSPDQGSEHIRPCVLCESDATDLGWTVREACASERRGPAKDGCHWSERRQEEGRWKTDTMAMRICWPGGAMCGGLRVGGGGLAIGLRGRSERVSERLWQLRAHCEHEARESRRVRSHACHMRPAAGARCLPFAGLSLLHASVISLICRRLPRQSCRATAARL